MRARQVQPPLVLPRAEVMAGIAEYCARFAEMLRSLDEAGWTTDTRCAGWEVRDVAGHVAGLFTDVAAGRMEGQGLPEVTARQAAQHRDLPPAKVAGQLARAGRRCATMLDGFTDQAWLARAPGGFPGPLRRAVLVLWYELYMHGDDVLSAIGREPDRGTGQRASVIHVAETLGLWGWRPATLALDGIEKLDVRGGGDTVAGDPLDFLLAATGRADPALLGLDDRVNIYEKGEKTWRTVRPR
jgi:uncharacterized protein (TIGR03083 family)